MDQITLLVSDLKTMVDSLVKDGMQYVSITLMESDEVNGDVIPPSAAFSGIHPDDPDEEVDFGNLDAVDVFE